jgi:hypothetical protein
MQYRASLFAAGYFGLLVLGVGALCLATLLISAHTCPPSFWRVLRQVYFSEFEPERW